jgi:hypothetical protein
VRFGVCDRPCIERLRLLLRFVRFLIVSPRITLTGQLRRQPGDALASSGACIAAAGVRLSAAGAIHDRSTNGIVPLLSGNITHATEHFQKNAPAGLLVHMRPRLDVPKQMRLLRDVPSVVQLHCRVLQHGWRLQRQL